MVWFKDEFFSWMDSPPCEDCNNTKPECHGLSYNPEEFVYTDRVEVMIRLCRWNYFAQFSKTHSRHLIFRYTFVIVAGNDYCFRDITILRYCSRREQGDAESGQIVLR